jgi:hypothetical protein
MSGGISVFGNKDVNLLVECAKRALEEEDRYLLNCFATRHWSSGADGIGIFDNINERYYQFIIWRTLMSSFPWRAKTERKGYDLAFYDDATGKIEAVAEIKGWWSDKGEQELPGIKRDLEKLELLRIPGVMLILTSQPSDLAEQNSRYLADKLGVSQSDMVTALFHPNGDVDWQFAVIGFLVVGRPITQK